MRRRLAAGVILILAIAAMGYGAGAAKPAAGQRLHLTFTERSPLSSLEEVCRRTDYIDLQQCDAATRACMEYDLAGESFEVFVPDTYHPQVPHGLFVFVSAGDAKVSPAWLDVFLRHQLIWISANNSGNRRPGPIRMGLALDAVHNMKKLYNLRQDRIYISGFSGGAIVSSYLVRGFPEVFSGGYFLMGGHFYTTYGSENGPHEPTMLGLKWQGPLDQVRKNMRLVLMWGEYDTQFNPRTERAQHEALRLDGFERARYVVVPGCGHTHPNAAWFETGLQALEQSRPDVPPVTSPTTDPNPSPGQKAQARRILATARYYLDMEVPKREDKRIEERFRRSFQDNARKYLQQVLEEYPTTPAAAKARTLLSEMPPAPPQ